MEARTKRFCQLGSLRSCVLRCWRTRRPDHNQLHDRRPSIVAVVEREPRQLNRGWVCGGVVNNRYVTQPSQRRTTRTGARWRTIIVYCRPMGLR